jgi:hypothetical protein
MGDIRLLHDCRRARILDLGQYDIQCNHLRGQHRFLFGQVFRLCLIRRLGEHGTASLRSLASKFGLTKVPATTALPDDW